MPQAEPHDKTKFLMQGILLTTFFALSARDEHRLPLVPLPPKSAPRAWGLYQLIFSVFMLAVTLSTSGISLAVTRMVTAAIAANRRGTVPLRRDKVLSLLPDRKLHDRRAAARFSDFAAAVILGYKGAAGSLRILALGLPMSLCTCMKGISSRWTESLSTALSDAVEQVLTIFAAVALFWYFAPQSIETACLTAMLASTFGEAVSFLSGWAAYRRSLRRNTPKKGRAGPRRSARHVPHRGALHAFGAARSMLSTAENLLIPRELKRCGLKRGAVNGPLPPFAGPGAADALPLLVPSPRSPRS